MSERRKIAIVRLVKSVGGAAAARGVEFDQLMADVAYQLLAERVEGAANRLGITEAAFLANYKDLLVPDEILDMLLGAKAKREEDLSGADVTIWIRDAGRVIMALAQASRMVSMNYYGAKKLLDVDAITVLDGAGDGGALFASALVKAVDAGSQTVTVSGAGVGLARQALSTVIKKFESGAWTTDKPELDARVAAGMAADLALLDD